MFKNNQKPTKKKKKMKKETIRSLYDYEQKKKYDMYLICRRNDNKGEKKNETNILRNRYKNQQKLPKFCVFFPSFVCLLCN